MAEVTPVRAAAVWSWPWWRWSGRTWTRATPSGAHARGAGSSSGRVRRALPHPLSSSRAWLRRRRDRPDRHPPGRVGGARHAGDEAGGPPRPEAHCRAALTGGTVPRDDRWRQGEPSCSGHRHRSQVVRSDASGRGCAPSRRRGHTAYCYRFRSSEGDRDLSTRFQATQTAEKLVPHVERAGIAAVALQFALVVPSGALP